VITFSALTKPLEHEIEKEEECVELEQNFGAFGVLSID